jgi:transposase
MMLEDLQILTSIKGINAKTAGPVLAEIGSIGKYASYKKLIAYAGLDPSIHQSGKFVGKSKLSKRGNRHLRRVIYLMTSCVVRVNDSFKAYFIQRKSEGMHSQKAIFATAHKLIRVIFAMLSQRTYFRAKEVS